MSTSSLPTGDYSPLQKKLHWAVVILLLAQYLLFDGIGRQFHQLVDTGFAVYNFTVIGHIAIGVTILALAILRLFLRKLHGAPLPPDSEPEAAKIASKYAHAGLYVLLFALPLSGLAAWFLQSRLLADVHEAGTTLLMWLAAGHVGAVAVHQLWWKTGILRRMT